MRAVVLGGAGFIGSHLVDRLLALDHEVVAVDSYVTGRRENLSRLAGAARFRFVEHDVCRPIPVVGSSAVVFNLASPASPIDYARLPLETLNVNPVGPRACYDEAKRFGEALVSSYARVHGIPVRIARIFNTYGPRMRVDDGRVVPAFVSQAIRGEDFTVFGDGTQTRSFCYVDDLVDGLVALWERGDGSPVNLGNPDEFTLLELAEVVRRVAGGGGKVRSVRPLPENDPRQRRPDISRASSLLRWKTVICTRVVRW